jgi:hypothetical protein
MKNIFYFLSQNSIFPIKIMDQVLPLQSQCLAVPSDSSTFLEVVKISSGETGLVFCRLPPDLLRLIADKLDINSLEVFIQSYKPFYNVLWKTKNYLISRGSGLLSITKKSFKNYMIKILACIINMGEELIKYDFRSFYMFMESDPEKFYSALYQNYRAYWKWHNMSEDFHVIDKNGKILKEFQSRKYLHYHHRLMEKMQEVCSLYEKSLLKMVPILPGYFKDFAGIIRKYICKNNKKLDAPNIIHLPAIFPQHWEIKSLVDFQSKYISFYKTSHPHLSLDRLKELTLLIYTIKIYDLIVLTIDDNTQVPFLVYKGPDNFFYISKIINYTIPKLACDLFGHFGVQYNEDLNELYGRRCQNRIFFSNSSQENSTFQGNSSFEQNWQFHDGIFGTHYLASRNDHLDWNGSSTEAPENEVSTQVCKPIIKIHKIRNPQFNHTIYLRCP